MVIQRTYGRYSTMRGDMLDDTVRWLEWALKNPRYVPRIPRFRVDSGMRFSKRFKVAFWSTVNHKIADFPYPWEER